MNINDFNADVLETLFNETEPMDVDIMGMTIEDVLTCLMSPESLSAYADTHYDTIIDRLSFIKGFIKKSNLVFATFKRYANDQSMEYAQAAAEVGGAPSLQETILTDLVGWYHLHSTSEAQALPFCDWYIMKKKEAYSGAVERRAQALINKKYQIKNNNPSK